LVSGSGHALSKPVTPEVPGLARFRGKTFHSSRWDHAFSLANKRVAVIGTGASAIQIVPSIAPIVAKLHVFQRTAPWGLPKPAGAISERRRRWFRRIPLLQRLARFWIYWRHEGFAIGFVHRPRWLEMLGRFVRRHVEANVPDPVLRAKVMPNY